MRVHVLERPRIVSMRTSSTCSRSAASGCRAFHRSRQSEEHTSELQSPCNLVCRLLLEKKKKKKYQNISHVERSGQQEHSHDNISRRFAATLRSSHCSCALYPNTCSTSCGSGLCLMCMYLTSPMHFRQDPVCSVIYNFTLLAQLGTLFGLILHNLCTVYLIASLFFFANEPTMYFFFFFF